MRASRRQHPVPAISIFVLEVTIFEYDKVVAAFVHKQMPPLTVLLKPLRFHLTVR